MDSSAHPQSLEYSAPPPPNPCLTCQRIRKKVMSSLLRKDSIEPTLCIHNRNALFIRSTGESCTHARNARGIASNVCRQYREVVLGGSTSVLRFSFHPIDTEAFSDSTKGNWPISGRRSKTGRTLGINVLPEVYWSSPQSQVITKKPRYSSRDIVSKPNPGGSSPAFPGSRWSPRFASHGAPKHPRRHGFQPICTCFWGRH